MNEAAIQKRVQVQASKSGATMFRQNVGLGWIGDSPNRSGDYIILHHPRPLHAGLCEGSSDLIGWLPVTVTQEMVGKRVAVFAALEVKSERGRVTVAQHSFLNAVHRSGGIAGVVRSPEDAERLIKGALTKLPDATTSLKPNAKPRSDRT